MATRDSAGIHASLSRSSSTRVASGGTWPAGTWPGATGRANAAAVIASNYHATLLDSALECLERAGIARGDGLNALAPLLEGTLRAILRLGPQEALTGPISRGDINSVRRNRQALKDVSQPTRDLYDVLALRTIEIMKQRGMPLAMDKEWKQVFE